MAENLCSGELQRLLLGKLVRFGARKLGTFQRTNTKLYVES